MTHDPHEALAMADRVAVLREGRIVQVGTPEQVYETPADTFVARFVGPLPMNLLARDDGHVGIRPEHVRIGDDLDASGDCVLREPGLAPEFFEASVQQLGHRRLDAIGAGAG